MVDVDLNDEELMVLVEDVLGSKLVVIGVGFLPRRQPFARVGPVHLPSKYL